MRYHNVRPDFVGRTSVLTPIPGYQPVPNAQRVAANFTMAPYFMNTINQFGDAAKLSLRDRFRMWWLSMKLKRQQAQIAKVAGLLPAGQQVPVAQGPLDPAAGTPVTMSSIDTANSNKEAAGLKITSGAAASGDDIMPPSVVKPEITAGTQISMVDATGYPFDFAAQIMNQVNNPYIGQRAAESAYHTFIRARTRGDFR